MAPFLSFTAEEAWKLVGASESIFLEEFWRFDAPDAALLAKWARIRALREVANKEIEAVREPAVGSSLQAELQLTAPPTTTRCWPAWATTCASCSSPLLSN
jgi:isoleucyl-tRNA synthetase